MTQGDFDVGRVVVAKAGRDKGKAFIIIQRLDDDYVFIADGVRRTVDNPKKKKVKHLKATPELDQNLKDRLESGARVLDADIRKSLKSLGYEK